MPPPRPVTAVLAVVVLALAVAGRAAPPEAPAPTPLAAKFPADLDFQETGDVTGEEALVIRDRHLFNDFSWRQFIALNWPADAAARGEPDRARRLGVPRDSQVVWGSWKSLDELFPADPALRPSEWESDDAELFQPGLNGRPAKDAGKTKILRSPIRIGTVAQAGFSATAKGRPLIAQNKTYVRYETRVNRTAYEFILRNGYYLRADIDRAVKANGPIAFPPGSVVVKAAWMEMTGVEKPERFYRTPAEIDDSPGPVLGPDMRRAEVGLVGFHIAHRTQSKPSWIWTTFEHVDNTEPGPGGCPASFSDNDPAVHRAEMDVQHPPPFSVADNVPLEKPVRPANVQRANAVHPTTHDVNLRYHRSSDVKDTVWQNYRLIATQWVSAPPGQKDPGETTAIRDFLTEMPPRRVLPHRGVTNTTIETYTQTESCLGCHRQAKSDFRFIFFPTIRARKP